MPIHTLVKSMVYTLKPEDEGFKTDKVYTLLMHSVYDSEYSLSVSQINTIIHLVDGVPTRVRFTSVEDSSKKMVLSLPEGNMTMQIQVKTLSSRFFPQLYYRYYE